MTNKAAADLALRAALEGAALDVVAGLGGCSMRLVAIVQSAQLPGRSPPRLKRWRRVLPLEALDGGGAAEGDAQAFGGWEKVDPHALAALRGDCTRCAGFRGCSPAADYVAARA